jgi:radical SAM protein with 4Fe4S-binding SPASM domain
MVYLKTTDTCQLHCDHCFTSGKNGKKGWFDVPRVIDFFERLHQYKPEFSKGGNISFHGGEPMLAPTEMMFDVWGSVKDLWPNIWWSVQTNLTYPLTTDKMDVFTTICNKNWGTSWDKGIRWPDLNKELLWEHNVREVINAGHELTVMVSVTKKVVDMEPIKIIHKLAELGIQHINFERVTHNGTANEHPDLFATNKELDAWFLKMWDQSVEHNTYKYIDNSFFDSILSSFVYKTHSGCRCRGCEQKIFTLNADGTIGGCPNGAAENQYGTIHDDIETLVNSDGRACTIQAEIVRHPLCYKCPVFDVCNGDCHQLSWQGATCAAPKSLMTKLKQEQDIPLYKKFLGDFVGQE